MKEEEEEEKEAEEEDAGPVTGVKGVKDWRGPQEGLQWAQEGLQWGPGWASEVSHAADALPLGARSRGQSCH